MKTKTERTTIHIYLFNYKYVYILKIKVVFAIECHLGFFCQRFRCVLGMSTVSVIVLQFCYFYRFCRCTFITRIGVCKSCTRSRHIVNVGFGIHTIIVFSFT